MMAQAPVPFVAQARVLPLTHIQRERVLPLPGQVTVAIGTQVDALDVVARANSLGQLRPIPLARYMRLNEAALNKRLLKQPGESVQAREIIASKPEYFGVARRIYRAPGNGRIASLQGTWITLDLSDAPFELRALYRGTVVTELPRRGVVIEAVGALVQGAWGKGEGYGVLNKVVETPNAMLTEDRIDVSVRGAVLVAGAGASNAAIKRAAGERAAGLIVGALKPVQLALLAELNLPVLLTEGLGERAMSSSIFQLLSAREGQEIAISAAMPSRAMRPEVFIPAPPSSSGAMMAPAPTTLSANIGARVRLVAAPNSGETGKISSIPLTPRLLESGGSAWGAEIELGSGDRVFVPWENLELVDE